jgi:hypothetical protein
VIEPEYRYIAGAKKLIVTPLYVDDELLAHIILGGYAKHWSAIRPMLERDGMPTARRALAGLYFLPAQLHFLNKREGLHDPRAGAYAEDGPENFGP